jgi:hypothetical protein
VVYCLIGEDFFHPSVLLFVPPQLLLLMLRVVLRSYYDIAWAFSRVWFHQLAFRLVFVAPTDQPCSGFDLEASCHHRPSARLSSLGPNHVWILVVP